MKKFILSLGTILCCLTLFSQPIYEETPENGEVEVTLHPGNSITIGSTHLVTFGVPFPRNTVNTTTQIVVTDQQGNEISSDIKELTRWHSLSDDPDVEGIRAVLLYVNITFDTLSPKTIKIKYGQNRTLELGTQNDVKDHWVVVQDPEDEYIDNTNDPNYVEIKEPAVYATLSPDWLNKCVIRTRYIPSSQSTLDYQWHDEAMINFGTSAVNDVADTVLDQYKVNVLERAPWLFDRAGCFWNLYFKTGELRWLKSSHRATQFYSKFLDSQGRFTLGNPSWLDDLKYSYGGSMLIDLMITGDIDLENKIIDVAEFAARENLRLEDGFAFWTERHFSYWLLAALSAFETTGNTIYKNQVNERAAHAFFRAKNPINGYVAEGGLLHPMGPHEGANRPAEGEPDVKGYYQPIISPWLSALLSDAIWRYYLHSEDEEALSFLVGLGENVARHCMYEVNDVHPNINGNIQPFYLFSGQTASEFSTNDIYYKPWDDDKHAPDVAGLLARTFWAQKKLGKDTSEILSHIENMFVTSKYTIDQWTRDAPERPRYRLQPARKFNWQFGTASDLEWLMINDPNETLSIPDTLEKDKRTFTIHPNPVESKLFISSKSLLEQSLLKFSIYDSNGKNLKNDQIKETLDKRSLDFSHLNSGIYFLKITSNNYQETIKFVKK